MSCIRLLYYWGEPERAHIDELNVRNLYYYILYIIMVRTSPASLYALYAVRDIFQRPHEETYALSGIPRA